MINPTFRTMRYFLELQYKGTHYRGWQRQLKIKSIQEKIEDCLGKIFKEKMTIHGCGRTDAGVHASQFFAHLYLENPPTFDLQQRLNYILPEDIHILRVFPVESYMNAQLSATSRTYIYRIHDHENPFLNQLSSYYPLKEAKLEIIEELAELIKTGTDFKAFCKRPNIYKHTLCEIHGSEFYRDHQSGTYIYKISANRFLRGMVRLITGTILEVAFGRMTMEEFKACLFEQKTLEFYRAAYPQGLYLATVEYGENGNFDSAVGI